MATIFSLAPILALCVAIHPQYWKPELTLRGAGASSCIAWRRGDLIDRGARGGKYQWFPRELQRQRAVSYWTWSPHTGEQIENLFLSSSTHSGDTIKGDNCYLALSSRPDIFFFFSSLFQHKSLWCHPLWQSSAFPGAGSPTVVMAFIEMSDAATITVEQSWECMRRGAGYGILFAF